MKAKSFRMITAAVMPNEVVIPVGRHWGRLRRMPG